MRQVVLDTETTGLDPAAGHRVIEIGCIELVNRKFTGNKLHLYLNPERKVDDGAFRVHGLSNEFLDDKPVFKEISDKFIQFVDGAELIIHNAPFDIGFLNSELSKISFRRNLEDLCSVLDTLEMARAKHPGQRNNLDALCKRYNVNNSNRSLHGALLDAEILAFVYLAMTGGQKELFASLQQNKSLDKQSIQQNFEKLASTSPIIKATTAELQRHMEFMQNVKKD